MFEAVITFVRLDEDDQEGRYPVTQVYRIEFDSKEAFEEVLEGIKMHDGISNSERLSAN